MNLKKEILDYLNSKPEWDILTKIYYIYIRVCKTFSYDYRFLYGDQKEKDLIYQKILDINYIEEFEIVCTTLCHVMKDMLKEIGIEAEITYDVKPHVFLIINIEPYKLKLDPMKNGYDLTRVKVENRTYGFQDLNKNSNFQEKINSSAKQIYGNYTIFTDECIEMLISELKAKDMFNNQPYQLEFNDKEMEYKMEWLRLLLNRTSRVKRYDDCDRYFDYLELKLMTEWEKSKIHKHVFWQKQNDNWKIIDLILLEYQNQKPVCFKLDQKSEKYYMDRITYEEMNYYLDNYEGEIKGLYRGLTM